MNRYQIPQKTSYSNYNISQITRNAPYLKTCLSMLSLSIFLISVLAGCGANRAQTSTSSNTNTPQPPERFVIASVPASSPLRPETRVSDDGIIWSGPSFPRNSAGGPAAIKNGVPPGIGANQDKYLLVWFDPTGTLCSQVSTNGVDWGSNQTHGTFTMIDVRSRPSVTYAPGIRKWFVAFKQSDGSVNVVDLGSDLMGRNVVKVPGIRADDAPSIAFNRNTGLVLISNTRGNPPTLFRMTSPDGQNWSTAAPITAGGINLESAPAPYVQYAWSQGDYYLAIHEITSTILRTGKIHVYKSMEASNWDLVLTIDSVDPDSEGPAIAGFSNNMLIANYKGANQITETWYNDTASLTPVNTRSISTVSLAYGPRSQSDLRNINFTFIRFQRLNPDSGTEDVTLRVEHLTADGQLIQKSRAYTKRGASKQQINNWTGDWGTHIFFSAYYKPNEIIRVFVDGAGNEVHEDFSWNTPPQPVYAPGSASVLRADQPMGNVAYNVYYELEVK